MDGNPINSLITLYEITRNTPLNTIPNIYVKIFFLDTKYDSMKLEIIINGNTYIKNTVAPLNRMPVRVAVIDGNSNMGIVFLIPNVNVEYTIKRFITLPTSICGLPINKGINTDREYIENSTMYSNLIFSSFDLYIFCNCISNI